MVRLLTCLATGLLVAQPVLAADGPSKSAHDRQLSEIVFQNYPPRALAAGEQGAVFFVVSLDKDAHPTNCQVTHGSGHPLLDAETCDLIVQHAVFGSAKDAGGRLTKQTAEGVVNWTLPGHAPVSFNPILLTRSEQPEAQVCRKSVKTGTLSQVERTCMTPTEWARQSDESRQPYEELQGRRGSTADQPCMGSCDTTLGQNSGMVPPLR